MSSIINASEYVLLDNAENATPLQRTPCFTPSECSSETPPSYESFALALSQHRLNYYLESVVLAKCANDEKTEGVSAMKAKSLLEQLYPGENVSAVYNLRLALFFRKHEQPQSAVTALEQIEAGINGKELPFLKEKEDRAAFWYYSALSLLEQGLHPDYIEEMAKNGIIEAVTIPDEANRDRWLNIGYFVTVVYNTLKGDDLEARFWKGRIPAGWTPPAELYSKYGGLMAGVSDSNTSATQKQIVQLPIALARDERTAARDLSALDGVTTQDILVRDVARLKREMNEVFDMAYVNYKEVCERIKAVHGILDSKESVGGKDLEELKRRMTYLERTVLR
ncbi:hypothetical protein H072_162 [Dactylellina haptotyla CBS 200.50]|uniref:Uncharacterized protein n=1 Tax=Dactylellina haptotyla (strain CBS 200.50) TaxID=1284197 RepID=S8ARZ7_DACHA|nr:hypothetical protein H072_162 [Dactylellina haptotyla CBS 200.50]